MKTRRILIALLLAVAVLCCAAQAEDAASLIIEARTQQAFTDEAVPEEDLTTILAAGLAAPSAINQQPWFFAVVTNPEVLDEIQSNAGGFAPPAGAGAPAGDAIPAGDKPPMPAAGSGAKAGLGDAPVTIIIYMDENTKSPNPDFDCGLACENMVIAAKVLGYGAKIISSPTMQLNGDNHDALCEKLGVDKAFTAVAVVLIGREDTAVDGSTSASVRNALEEKVSFVK